MENGTAGNSTFNRMMHIGIVVRDMDRAVRRLTELGIAPWKTRMPPADARETYRGQPFIPAQRVNIKIAQIGSLELELIQPLEGESPHREFLETKGEGIQHLGFMVEDLNRAVGELTGKGSAVMLTSEFKGGGGVAYLDLDVAGLIVELVQRPASPRPPGTVEN